jgi:hypothetical protein
MLLTFEVSERHDNITTAAVSNTLEITLFNSSDGNAVVLNEVFESEIIDTSRAEDNVGTSLNDLLASLACHVHLTLTNLFKVLWILNEDLNSHLKSVLVEVEVNEGNFSIIHMNGHALGRSTSLNSITINEARLLD